MQHEHETRVSAIALDSDLMVGSLVAKWAKDELHLENLVVVFAVLGLGFVGMSIILGRQSHTMGSFASAMFEKAVAFAGFAHAWWQVG